MYLRDLVFTPKNSLRPLLALFLLFLGTQFQLDAYANNEGASFAKFSLTESPARSILRERRGNTGDIELEINAHGRHFQLRLQENKRILRRADRRLKAREVELYSGEISGIPGSWARLSKVEGVLSGAFYDGSELYIVDTANAAIQSLEDSRLRGQVQALEAESVIYKSSSIESIGDCGTAQSSASFEYQQLVGELNELTGVTANAAGANSEIELVVVLDTEYQATNGADPEAVALAQINVVDGIFSEQVGVQIFVKDIVSLANNGAMSSTSAQNLIYSFRDYVNSQIGNPGVAHLLTGKNLDGSTVGIAFLDAICSSYGVGLTQAPNFSNIASLVAAHEIGHNFGAPHDNQSGSACATTPGTYLMNPYINGSDQFSNCSLIQIASTISGANCLSDVSDPVGTAPSISSTANLNATVDVAYHYDADDTLYASGTAPIEYALDAGPQGMSVTNDGLVTWTPAANQVGVHPVQISASNGYGTDTQSFEINVEERTVLPGLDFYDYPPSSYGGSQDGQGNVSIEDGGATLHLSGNRWQAVDFPYQVTPGTVIEFDYRSTALGEVHAIGLDDDNGLSSNRAFQVQGTQNWGNLDWQYSGSGDWQHFVIPVGQFYTGAMSRLFFAMDHDVSNPAGNAYFRDVQVYESGSAPHITSTPNQNATAGEAYSYDADGQAEAEGSQPITFYLDAGPAGLSVSDAGLVSWVPSPAQVGDHQVYVTAVNDYGSDTQEFTITVAEPVIDNGVLDFNENAPSGYGGSQDNASKGTVTILDGGATLLLEGNRWQAVDFPYEVTTDTVIEFEFKSTQMGEVHAIGLDDNNSLSSNRAFELFGSQDWGSRDFSYSGSGDYEQFSIPMGQYYTGSMQRLFFAMDHDVSNPTGDSYFRNVRIYNESGGGSAPSIVSEPNLNAMVGEDYAYDDDSYLEVNGDGIISYRLDAGPDGMTIGDDGLVTWIPDSSQVGSHAVVITVTNASGSDSQSFTVLVSEPPDDAVLDFVQFPPSKYGGSQDKKGTVTIAEGGVAIQLVGNRWQAVDFPYTLTPNSVLEFEFRSSSEGEVHAIGLDNDNSTSENRGFMMFGSQPWANMDFVYSGNGNYQQFSIPVGQYYTGDMQRLFFIMDHDTGNPTGESVFRNVKVRD